MRFQGIGEESGFKEQRGIHFGVAAIADPGVDSQFALVEAADHPRHFSVGRYQQGLRRCIRTLHACRQLRLQSTGAGLSVIHGEQFIDVFQSRGGWSEIDPVPVGGQQPVDLSMIQVLGLSEQSNHQAIHIIGRQKIALATKLEQEIFVVHCQQWWLFRPGDRRAFSLFNHIRLNLNLLPEKLKHRRGHQELEAGGSLPHDFRLGMHHQAHIPLVA